MKKGFPWTLQEDAWFRVVGADFKRYRADGKDSKDDTSFFVSRTLDAWYEAFPERHPRTFRQHSKTAEEATRVILGTDTLRMHEVCIECLIYTNHLIVFNQRVRHKLNYNKNLVTPQEVVSEL